MPLVRAICNRYVAPVAKFTFLVPYVRSDLSYDWDDHWNGKPLTEAGVAARDAGLLGQQEPIDADSETEAIAITAKRHPGHTVKSRSINRLRR